MLWGALLLAAVPTLLPARTGGTLRAAPAPPAKASSDVDTQVGISKYLADGRSIAMSQGVQFTQDDAVLKTDNATALLDKEHNLLSAEAPGPVHLYDPQDDLTGERGTINFPSHLATLSGNVVLRVIPGKREANAPAGSARRQFKDPATLTCAVMTYDYRRKIGKIPGPLTVRQIIQRPEGPLTRTLTADAGLYSGRAQTVLLVGTVKGQDSDGSVITNADTRASGKPIIIGIKEGAETINIPFKTTGKFKVKPQTDDGKGDGDGLDDVPPVPPPAASTGNTPSSITNIAPPVPVGTANP